MQAIRKNQVEKNKYWMKKIYIHIKNKINTKEFKINNLKGNNEICFSFFYTVTNKTNKTQKNNTTIEEKFTYK